ncbi:MAG: ATP-binding protein [Actinomycetota bacterium]|nr:ATP-binding protein [Actinomycetota bacterium]
MLRHKLRTRITTKVVALSVAAAALLATALLILIVAIVGQRDAARTAFRSQQALSLGNQLETTLVDIENAISRYVQTGKEGHLGRANGALRGYPTQRDALARHVSDDPGQQRRVRAIGVKIDDYANYWAHPLIGVARKDLADARSQVVTDGGRTRIDTIRREFDGLFARERAVIASREDRAEARSSSAIAFGIGGVGLVLSIALGFTLYLRRSVVRPVLRVAEATGRLADGELATRVPAQRLDELGDLARSFNSMADSLQRSRTELEHSNAELTRSNAELEQFASVTSHDLQAPLTTISMYAELLERRHGAEDPEKGPALIDGIRHATSQARALIRDLLEYSRAGRGPLSLERVPAGIIVEQAMETLAGAIEQSGALVRVGSLPVILADRANLGRVFQNLIGNAVKFTFEETPDVSIEAERDRGQWRFSVRDNGIGMEPEQSERIFEPFQRLHGEDDYPGTGIGLAVCERIIDQHGGKIWVSTRPGEGSVFHFTLPAGGPAEPIASDGADPRVGAGSAQA